MTDVVDFRTDDLTYELELGPVRIAAGEVVSLAVPSRFPPVLVRAVHPMTQRILDATFGPCTATVGVPNVEVSDGDQVRRSVTVGAAADRLSGPYVPFTIVKQALRRAVALGAVASTYLPVHGVVFRIASRLTVVIATGQAGKTFLVDRILEAVPEAEVVSDDWTLVDIDDRTLHRLGDRHLHVRGTFANGESVQLAGARFDTLVERCDSDPFHNESRYLVARTMKRVSNPGPDEPLAGLVFLTDSFDEPFTCTEATAREVDLLIDAGTANVFWDMSNAYLGPATLEELAARWRRLLASTRVVRLRGHRTVDAGEVVDTLLEWVQ